MVFWPHGSGINVTVIMVFKCISLGSSYILFSHFWHCLIQYQFPLCHLCLHLLSCCRCHHLHYLRICSVFVVEVAFSFMLGWRLHFGFPFRQPSFDESLIGFTVLLHSLKKFVELIDTLSTPPIWIIVFLSFSNTIPPCLCTWLECPIQIHDIFVLTWG
jgi:hypothetical protein